MTIKNNNFAKFNWFHRFMASATFAISYFIIFFALVSFLNSRMGFNLLNSTLYNWSFIGSLGITIVLRTFDSDNYMYTSWQHIHFSGFCIIFLFCFIMLFIPGLPNEIFYFLMRA